MSLEVKGKLTQHKIKRKDVAEVLGIHKNTLYHKLEGHQSFTVDEALKIQKEFLPEYDLSIYAREKQSAATPCSVGKTI